ncbi:MAG: hypothetical protein ILO10_04700 [Kiritimatiellae bacterium]|nr:hypothetical protein [Kiritimatiellia bacterium]
MKTTLATFGRALLAALLVPVLSAVFAACDVSSTDSVSGSVSNSAGESYDFTGTYYASPVGSALVTPEEAQSGEHITWLRLMQSGSSLQGYDSAKQSWSGKISSLSGETAQFSLKGRTSAGHAVDIVGSLSYNSGSASMNASWIEDSGSAASIYGYATVATNSSNVHTNNNVTNNVSTNEVYE